MDIGLIGLGFMGSLMGKALLGAGHAVRVFDIDEARRDELAGFGAVPVTTAAESADGRDVVVTMLPGPDQVRDAIGGDHGVLAAGSPPRIVVDCTTNSHALVLELAQSCTRRGIAFVDAPVTGRPPHATFFVGGAPAPVAELEPLFDAMGTSFTHLGEAGAGTVGKLVNQQILYGTYVVVLEGLLLAVKAGIDPEVLVPALHQGPARSAALGSVLEKVLRSDATDHRGAPLRLVSKDLRLLGELLADHQMSSSVAPALIDAFAEAEAAGHGDHHFSAVMSTLAARSSAAPVDDKDVVRRFVDLWNAGTPEKLGEVVEETFVWHGIDGAELHGLDEYVQFVTRRSPGARRISIERLAAEKEWVMARLRIERSDDSSFHTHDLFHIEHGRITREWSGHS